MKTSLKFHKNIEISIKTNEKIYMKVLINFMKTNELKQLI